MRPAPWLNDTVTEMQTSRQSMIEVCANTGVGMLGSWLITIAVLFSIEDKVLASITTVVLCTVWSLVRGYYIRRHFNKRLHREYHPT